MVLAITAIVWQKFHILSRAQVLVVASVCAAAVALGVALASIPADGTSWHRFLGPFRQLDPFINFGSAVVAVLPVFLVHYHLARLGALLDLVVFSFGVLFDSCLRRPRVRIPSGGSRDRPAGGYICGPMAAT